LAIDVASGNVHLEFDDVSIPGKVDLVWDRAYSGALVARADTMLGSGWTCRYGAALTRLADRYEFVTPSGAVESFPDTDGAVERGEIVRHLGAYLEIYKQAGRYIVQSWNVESGDILRYCFRPGTNGTRMPLVAIENVIGQGVDLVYDRSGHLTGIQQRLERRMLVLGYHANGLVNSVTLQAPNGERRPIVRYEYDGAGRLSAAFDPLGNADRFEYDKHARVARELAKDGGVRSYKYDEDGRCVRYSGLDRYDEKTLRYLPASRTTVLTDSYGGQTIFYYLPTGQIVRMVDALGGEATYEYDEFGRIVTKTTPGGAKTGYKYDENGNRVEICDGLGGRYLFAYNALHLPDFLMDPNGQPWRREYDAANRLIATSNPLGSTWRIQYDEHDNPVAIVDPKGSRIEQRFYDGLVHAATDWQGNWTEFTYDAFGNIKQAIQPDGSVTTYSHDVCNNILRITMPDASTRSYTYDAAANITSITNGNGQRTEYRFGPCGRLLEINNKIGLAIRFVWGTEPGYLDKVVNEKGENYLFTRDKLGRSIKEVSFDGLVNTFKYDADGRLIELGNGNGETVAFIRDVVGNTLQKQLPDGMVFDYQYDTVGNLISAISPDITVSFERDAIGRIVKETQGEHWIARVYDAVSNIVRTHTSLGHDVSFRFDANHRIKRLRASFGAEIGFERDHLGNETVRSLPGNVCMMLRHDPMGRLVEQTVEMERNPLLQSAEKNEANPLQHIVARRYTYDRGGQLSTINDARWGTTEYVYDPMQRLIRAVRSKGLSECFGYDATGNCISIMTGNGTAREEILDYGSGNRILRRGDTEYVLDGQGRLARKSEDASTDHPRDWTYQWDALDQLRTVRTPEGTEYRFEYDALGRRVAKTGQAGTTRFLWDKDVVIQELRPESPEVSWVMDPHGFSPLARIHEGKMYPVINDHLGTPRELLDSRGEIVWAASYRAWGAIDHTVSLQRDMDCPLRFQGQWADEETGLHYNFYRYYDPHLGAFISQDPIGWEGETNLYRYTKNPVNWIDPLGLICTTHKGADDQGYVVYHITDGKKPPTVLYVGITEKGRFRERILEHESSGRKSDGRDMYIADHAENYGQARGYEQAHIEHYKTLKTEGRGKSPEEFPGNRQRSYNPDRLSKKNDERANTFNGYYTSKMKEAGW